jgi:RNA polymerase sigma factor (sigma-70 family)
VIVVPMVNDSHNVQCDRNLESKSEDNDFYLIQKCLQGDTKSFRLLYQQHSPRIRSILYQLCEASNLDDLVQEVFIRVWKGLPKFRASATFSTWLYRIAWNVAYDQRQELRQKRTQLQALSQKIPLQEEAPDLMKIHYQDLIQRGLTSLTFDHRTILVLHDLEEIPQKEVAEILEIPLGTVKSRLFHARAALRLFLQEQGVEI